MEMPKGVDIEEWVEYFYSCRAARLENDGHDIATDPECMFGWFCWLYQMGYDKHRVEIMFRDAGVDNISDYMDKLMNGEPDEPSEP